MLVGRPLAVLLSRKGTDAVVTLLHSAAPAIASVIRGSDAVIAAVGRPGHRGGDAEARAAAVGIGSRYVEGQMCFDVAGGAEELAGWLTPVHGSVWR